VPPALRPAKIRQRRASHHFIAWTNLLRFGHSCFGMSDVLAVTLPRNRSALERQLGQWSPRCLPHWMETAPRFNWCPHSPRGGRVRRLSFAKRSLVTVGDLACGELSTSWVADFQKQSTGVSLTESRRQADLRFIPCRAARRLLGRGYGDECCVCVLGT